MKHDYETVIKAVGNEIKATVYQDKKSLGHFYAPISSLDDPFDFKEFLDQINDRIIWEETK